MKELEDSSKQLALELVVTIAENAPAMMRKHSKFLPAIGVVLCMLDERIERGCMP